MDDATTPICEGKLTVSLDLGDKYTQVCVSVLKARSSRKPA
jgi:hypothetical protein